MEKVFMRMLQQKIAHNISIKIFKIFKIKNFKIFKTYEATSIPQTAKQIITQTY